MLLLTTKGRRTGLRRTTPLQYLADGEAFIVVASNAGAPRPPAWWLNLLADPHARIQVGADVVDVVAREATGHARSVLWLRLTEANRYLDRAVRKARRELPVVILTPAP